MELIIIWILFGLCAAAVAQSRGSSGCAWFIAGVFLGPFALLFAFFAGTGYECPYCKKSIHRDATKCPYCQSDLSGTEKE